jgi:hypothetical protein
VMNSQMFLLQLTKLLICVSQRIRTGVMQRESTSPWSQNTAMWPYHEPGQPISLYHNKFTFFNNTLVSMQAGGIISWDCPTKIWCVLQLIFNDRITLTTMMKNTEKQELFFM